MTAREIAHILTITPDPDNDEDWEWEITCLYEPDGFDRAGCPCSTLMECDCKLSDDETDQVHSDGEGPCPKSPEQRDLAAVEGLVKLLAVRAPRQAEGLIDNLKIGLFLAGYKDGMERTS